MSFIEFELSSTIAVDFDIDLDFDSPIYEIAILKR